MKPASAKQKGRRLQQQIRDRLRTWFGWGDDDVWSRSTGAGGEDIMLSPHARSQFPYSVECKNVERLQFWGSWQQAKDNAGPYEPLLVVSRNRDETLVVLRFETFLKLKHTSE